MNTSGLQLCSSFKISESSSAVITEWLEMTVKTICVMISENLNRSINNLRMTVTHKPSLLTINMVSSAVRVLLSEVADSKGKEAVKLTINKDGVCTKTRMSAAYNGVFRLGNVELLLNSRMKEVGLHLILKLEVVPYMAGALEHQANDMINKTLRLKKCPIRDIKVPIVFSKKRCIDEIKTINN